MRMSAPDPIITALHVENRRLRAALAEAGSPASEIGGRVGVFGRLASPFGETCRKLGTRGAAKALRALSEADVALKSTAEEPRIVLERTLLGLLRSGASAA